MLAASVAVLVANAAQRRQSAEGGRLQARLVAADLSATIGVVGIRQLPIPPADRNTRRPLEVALQRCRESLQESPESEPIIWRIGALTSVLHGRDAAWRWFRGHPVHPRAAWEDAYAPGTLSSQELSRALKALQPVRPRWCRDLVRAQLYLKAGQPARAIEVLDTLREREARATTRLIWLVAGVLGALGLGLGAQGVLYVLAARGRLRPIDRPLPFSGLATQPLAEAFILWFFVVLVGGFALRHLVAWLTGRAQLGVAAQLALLLGLEVTAAASALALAAAAARRAEPRAGDGDGLIFESPPARERRAWVDRQLLDAGWGMLIYLGSLPVLFLAAAFLSRLLPNVPTPPNPAATLALGARGVLEWALLVAVASVAAPVFEEVFFRGILYTALRRRLRPLAAILTSGLLFALVHPQLPLGFFPIWILGIGFAWMVELRRSLVPSVVAHMLNNAAALVLVSLLRLP